MFLVGSQRGYILLNLRSIKVAGYKVRKVFDKDPLAVEQNNYETKIVIAYVVCDLGTWRNNPLRNFA